jgi:hypothetical protein
MAERTDAARGPARWGAAAGVALASVAVIAVLSRRGDDAQVVRGADRCAIVVAEAGWDAAARRALIAGNPEATATAAWLADAIDYRAARWPAARRAACVPPRDAAIDCLIELAPELPAAARARGRTAAQLVAVVGALRDPERCTAPGPAAIDVAALERAPDPAAIARVLPVLAADDDPRVLADYARVLVLRAGLAADPGEALASAQAALVVAERIYGAEHPALLAVLARIGQAQGELGQLDDELATRARARAIAARLPADAAPRIQAIVDHARALGRRDPEGGLASLDLLAAQSGLPPALRAAVDAARADLRARR